MPVFGVETEHTMGILRRARRAQQGQVILFAALILPVLLGMTALAIDVGGYADDKRTLQNAADAIALAAAHDMCTPDPHSCSDTSAATTAANAYAQRNNIDTSKMTVTFLGGNTAPKVRVTITTNHRFAFIRILGVNSKDVSATAASVKVSPGGIPGVVPFGVTQATLDAAGSGNLVQLKMDASDDTTPGNFGAIDVDGGGSSTYESDLTYGSPSTVCSTSTSGCTQTACASGAFPSPCAENAPNCAGPECSTETGNMKGGTRDGVQFRLDHTSAACDTFGEVFGGGPGTYTVNPACNPWGAGSCPTPTALCSRRVIVVPIIDQWANGNKPINILGFSLFFLDGFANGCQTGNDCKVIGRFVDASVTLNALAGAYDPDASIHYERLVE